MAGRRRASGRGFSAPVSQPLAPARGSRSARTARRKRQRRLRSGAGVGVAALLVVAVVAFVVTRAVRRDEPADEATTRTQRTLLLQVQGSDRAALTAALLAQDPEPRTSSLVLVPPSTVTEVPGYGTLPFRNALRLGGPRVAREAASDLVGVLVDEDWTLDSGTFAQLVDAVGGVVLDLDRDMVVPGPQRGTTVVLARAGAGQRLDGTTALRWSTYVAAGEDELAALPRFQAVFEALVTAFPDDPTRLATTLGALGSGSQTSQPAAALATFLGGVRDAHAADRFEPAILPVNPIDVGSGKLSYGIKPDEVAALVSRTLAASVPEGRLEGNNRVLVQNGVGTPGIGQSVARKLTPEGFDIVATRNAPNFGYKESLVLVFDMTDAARAQGQRVAKLLGLPASSVRVATLGQTVADVIVIVGADYKR